MRISDWSSDVCSSDLIGGLTERAREHGRRLEHRDFEALEAIEPPHAIEHIGDAREAALVLAENVLRAADAVGGVDTGHKRGVLYARRGEIASISSIGQAEAVWRRGARCWLCATDRGKSTGRGLMRGQRASVR